MSGTLVVNEIYLSLQGESTYAGLPCIFVRLTACNLRCSYCDTAYAFTQGQKIELEEIAARVEKLAEPFKERALVKLGAAGETANVPLVEFTGGEPLLQKNVLPLLSTLCDRGYTVLVETSGALDIGSVDPRVRRIMDLKCPSSGEADRNRWENLPLLKATDEIKFVIGTREDYEWTRDQIRAHRLAEKCTLLVSWVHPLQPGQRDKSLKEVPHGHAPISRQDLVQRIIEDALPVRFQIQMHKVIWPPDQRGV